MNLNNSFSVFVPGRVLRVFVLILLLSGSLHVQDVRAAPGRVCLEKDGQSLRIRRRCTSKKGRQEISLAKLLEVLASEGAVGPQGPQGVAGPAGQDRAWGDGSAGAKIFDSTANFTDDNPQFTDITIESGVFINFPAGTILRCTGTFTNDGTLQAVAPSARSNVNRVDADPMFAPLASANRGLARRSATPGQGVAPANFAMGGEPGVGFGPESGDSESANLAYSLLRVPIFAGGGGGTIETAGSNLAYGGGGLGIFCQGAIVNNGSILADGSDGPIQSLGGGGGGVVLLASATSVDNNGMIEVNGGNGGPAGSISGASGGGGGGLVHILAPIIDVPPATVDISGGSGAAAVGAGTINNGTDWYGGSGGGASFGDGGRGGLVMADGSSDAGVDGEEGLLLTRIVDNPAGLLN